MWITESLKKNDRRGYQELCSDCDSYGLKKHGLTRYFESDGYFTWTEVRDAAVRVPECNLAHLFGMPSELADLGAKVLGVLMYRYPVLMVAVVPQE